MSVRVRFAPSPTGQVHIGNIRAAIFNWLFARHEGGAFLLRIEDTDLERSTPEAIRTLLDALDWLGLDYDEEPVYQSSRVEAHLAAAEQLLSKGLAYREDKGGTGKGECTVFRMPGTDMSYVDEVKGALHKRAEDMKDLVIVRSNGTPVFHLANVVDDIHMGITHIMRGDDHVENTYRHVALFQALGADAPRYAHLPMITNAQGKPYSKRDGAAFVGEFRENGFLPDTLFNFLALLGWSPGDDREVMTRAELIEAFGLKRVLSSPAKMDMDKLLWMNGEYLRALPPETFAGECRRFLEQSGQWQSMCAMLEGDEPDAYFGRVMELMQVRVRCVPEIGQAAYFFGEDYPVDEKNARKRLKKPEVVEALRTLPERFDALPSFDGETAEQALRQVAEANELNPGHLIHALRVAVSGVGAGPGLFDMLGVLGRKRVVRRIERTLARHGC